MKSKAIHLKKNFKSLEAPKLPHIELLNCPSDF